MSDKTFVDTNIVVYAHDLDAGHKHKKAKAILESLWETKSGVLSTQVLQEFYVTLTKKIPRPLDRSIARRIVRIYFAWDVVVNHPELILQASEIEESHKISFWDALIISAAFSRNVDTILTEDLNHGQYVEGILIKNPFI
jgi:predicted nucleic acid-binding protein